MVTFSSLSYFITSRHQIEERIGQTHTFSSEILQNATYSEDIYRRNSDSIERGFTVR